MAVSERGPRERMVFSAAQLIRRDGVTATGMRTVASHAQVPRGSLQHYFPDGKEQLVNEAVTWAGHYAGSRISRFLGAMSRPSPSGLFAAMVGQWTEEFQSAGFAAGCPVAAATVDCADTVESTRSAAAAAFAGDSVYRGRIENRIRHRNTLRSSVEAWTTAVHAESMVPRLRRPSRSPHHPTLAADPGPSRVIVFGTVL